MPKNHTLIPDDLLVEIVELADWIRHEANEVHGDSDAPPVTFSVEYLEQLEPLFKWLEYMQAVWAREGEREYER